MNRQTTVNLTIAITVLAAFAVSVPFIWKEIIWEPKFEAEPVASVPNIIPDRIIDPPLADLSENSLPDVDGNPVTDLEQASVRPYIDEGPCVCDDVEVIGRI